MNIVDTIRGFKRLYFKVLAKIERLCPSAGLNMTYIRVLIFWTLVCYFSILFNNIMSQNVTNSSSHSSLLDVFEGGYNVSDER